MTSAKVDRFSKLLDWQIHIHKQTPYASIIETSTSLELYDNVVTLPCENCGNSKQLPN